MRGKIILGVLLGLLLSSPAFAVRTILYYENECCRNITEGEFAILYCQGLKLKEPAQGWTVQTAAAALSSLGHQPEGGWVLSRFLSEAVLSRLLKNSPFYRKPYTESAVQKSDLLVPIAKARSIVPADEGISQGEFAILVAMALKLPIPPGCGPETAIKTLTSFNPAIKPMKGWKSNAALIESDMMHVLFPTTFHPTTVDPNMEISALQVYSLLFGKYEIATQGHFGLFVIDALGVPTPPGGWNRKSALAYLTKEFGLGGDFAGNPNAPLCAQAFESGLRQILLKVQEAPAASQQPELMEAMMRRVLPAFTPQSSLSSPESPSGSYGYAEFEQKGGQGQSNKEVEAFIKEVRRTGLIPADRCAMVPAQNVTKGNLTVPPPPPPPPPGQPVSTTVPKIG